MHYEETVFLLNTEIPKLDCKQSESEDSLKECNIYSNSQQMHFGKMIICILVKEMSLSIEEFQ